MMRNRAENPFPQPRKNTLLRRAGRGVADLVVLRRVRGLDSTSVEIDGMVYVSQLYADPRGDKRNFPHHSFRAEARYRKAPRVYRHRFDRDGQRGFVLKRRYVRAINALTPGTVVDARDTSVRDATPSQPGALLMVGRVMGIGEATNNATLQVETHVNHAKASTGGVVTGGQIGTAEPRADGTVVASGSIEMLSAQGVFDHPAQAVVGKNIHYAALWGYTNVVMEGDIHTGFVGGKRNFVNGELVGSE